MEPTPDLEKARDEKCVPVAREILAEMVTGLLADDRDPLLLSILQKSLDADMNITTEAQYLFQLLLGAFSGLNTTLHSLELTPVDETRYTAIGNEILAILSESDVRLTNIKPEDIEKDFAAAKVKLQELFTREKLTRIELSYLVERIFTSITDVNNSFSAKIEQSLARAEAKIFGVESMSDITVKHVNDVLTHDVSVMFSDASPELPPDGQATPPSGDGKIDPPAPEGGVPVPA